MIGISLRLLIALSVISPIAVAAASRAQNARRHPSQQLSTSVTNNSEKKSIQGLDMKLRFGLGLDDLESYSGEDRNELVQRKSLGGSYLNLDLVYLWDDVANLYFSPEFRYKSGFEYNAIDKDTSPSRFAVAEASVEFFPNSRERLSPASLRVGLINLKNTKSVFYHDNQAYAGVMVTGRVSLNNADLSGWAQNYLLSSNNNQSLNTKEQKPSYEMIAGGTISWQTNKMRSTASPFRNPNNFFKVYYDQILNPSSSLAYESAFRGNLVKLQGDREGVFEYDFKNAVAEFRNELFVYKGISWIFESTVNRNLSAESELNTAWIVSNSIIIRHTFFGDIQPGFNVYSLQPNSFLAATANPRYLPNSQGYEAVLKFYAKKDFLISLAGARREALYLTPYQYRENFYQIKLEFNHDAT